MNNWKFTKTKLKENKAVYLMINIQSHGSSPGKQGFSMVVCSDGSLNGSIGGGIMEYNLVEHCKELLSKNQYQNFIKKQVHKGNVTDGSGMICSGKQTVAFIALTPSDLQSVTQITECLNDKKTGILNISPKGYSFDVSNNNTETQYNCTVTDNNNWNYSEVIGFKSTLYIIGAGHVGFAVSKLFSQLGYKVVVFDNRPNLDMLTDNIYADTKLIIDYKNVAQHISESENSYIVIMTNNHTHDQEALSKLIRKKVRYIGLMGSKDKVAGLKKSMSKVGFTNNELNWVHAPIGMSINSKTPDEIAISIAAEIIAVKNEI